LSIMTFSMTYLRENFGLGHQIGIWKMVRAYATRFLRDLEATIVLVIAHLLR
jgi:hypothetical protein